MRISDWSSDVCSSDLGLLAPDEPRPFELFNAAGRAPLLLLCDHATRFIPRALDSLGLDEAALTRPIAWDLGIAEVTRQLARPLHAPAVLSHLPRPVPAPTPGPATPTTLPEGHHRT